MDASVIELVSTRSAFRDFVELPRQLHPRALAVPLLEATLRSWWRGRSAHPQPIELLLVRDARGRAVARSSVHTDPRLDERLGAPSLLFGATEFADAAAAAELFAAIDQRADGRSQLVGPVSLLPNQAGGVITSGFAQRGFVDSAWNPASYPGIYEGAGFERLWESDTWVVETRATAPAPEQDWAAAGLRLEYGSRRRIGELIPELLTLLNRSFAALPYYTPITPAEMAAATDGLAYLLDEKLLLLARDSGSGEAVAFVLVVPDITLFLQRIGGRMSLPRQLQLLATRRRYRDEAILIIQGTDPTRQGRGILSLLSRQLQANLAAGGYRRLRSTYVGRDNIGSARQFARFGGTPLHGYTFYRRSIL
ncbi:hypothetical protein HQQ81_01445 [Microbacteriaceae bacterium VKM Ac-2854]|nr:hypothetical protein [Microbacteriaceae bacterium VKM Ac-2854]